VNLLANIAKESDFIKKKVKGFTLIETVIVMSLISIITAIIFIEIKNYRDFRNELDAKYFDNEILYLINEGRHTCMLNEEPGEIMFNENNNKGGFYQGVVLKDRLNIPDGFVILDNTVNTSDHLIYIDDNGVISTPCSLEYIDRTQKIHTITIGVGTAYAQIKQ
jgi:prepilin-type N-terminal cleavage/methylation domain-containing protein